MNQEMSAEHCRKVMARYDELLQRAEIMWKKERAEKVSTEGRP